MASTTRSMFNAVIGGEVYDLTDIEYYESGKVKEGRLASDKTVSIGGEDYTFKAGEWLEFYESGKVKGGILASSKTVSIGGNAYTFDSGYNGWIQFYESGKVKGGKLASSKTVSIGGEAYTFKGWIYFYESGKVEGGTLASFKTVSVGGEDYNFKAGELIWFYESGKVWGGKLADAKTVSIGGVDYTFNKWLNNDWIHFYESGKVKGSTLAFAVTVAIGSVDYTFDSRIDFYESGKVKWGEIVKQRVPIGKDKRIIDEVMYTEDEQLIQIRLSEASAIRGKASNKAVTLIALAEALKAMSVIRLYTDGTIAGTDYKWDNNWTGEKPKPKKSPPKPIKKQSQ